MYSRLSATIQHHLNIECRVFIELHAILKIKVVNNIILLHFILTKLTYLGFSINSSTLFTHDKVKTNKCVILHYPVLPHSKAEFIGTRLYPFDTGGYSKSHQLLSLGNSHWTVINGEMDKRSKIEFGIIVYQEVISWHIS